MAVKLVDDDLMGPGCAVAFFAIMAAAALGWVINIVKIFASLNEPVTGLFIGRIIGAFIVPIGCIVGWV